MNDYLNSHEFRMRFKVLVVATLALAIPEISMADMVTDAGKKVQTMVQSWGFIIALLGFTAAGICWKFRLFDMKWIMGIAAGSLVVGGGAEYIVRKIYPNIPGV